MNNDDLFLLLDINKSMQRSLISINSFIKYGRIYSENLEYQKRVYEKYIKLSSNLVDKVQKLNWFEKGLIMMKYLILYLFKQDLYFMYSFVEKDISYNMRNVILSNGNYDKASSDIKLLTKYYLSIETRLIKEIRKRQDFRNIHI